MVCHASSGIVFGFMRHAVIAPTDQSSMQPIASEDTGTLLVMNGEIFEYEDLRKKLFAQGVRLRSSGDAETLLYRYRIEGDQFCNDIDSMFSVALYDESRGYPRIVLARDWVGELPLHYIYDQDTRTCIFGSEIKAFLELNDYSIKDIKSLEPGTIIEVNMIDFSYRQWRYVAPFQETFSQKLSPEEIGVELRTLLEGAAKKRILSDVPLCCLLSGGIDSTVTSYLISSLAKTAGKKVPLSTFHVAEEPISEETDLYHARRVARFLGLEEHLVEVCVSQEEIVSALPEVLYALEDTRNKDFNLYPAFANFFLARAIHRDGIKVAFSGEGSDELHGSYASWGSFSVAPDEIIQNKFRKKLVSNLHKGVLARTSKVMMYAGPVEMRTLFLSRAVAGYILSLTPQCLRSGTVWKMPLVWAFQDVIPFEYLSRPKARPQDATGIMAVKDLIEKRYRKYGISEKCIREKIFDLLFVSKEMTFS